jgi:hypothetical protein
MNERESRLIADQVVAPDFGDVNLVVFAQTPRDIDHPRWHVEMKRRADPSEMRPLRQGFEMIHRLAGFDLDHDLDLVPAVLGHEDQIGVQGRGSRADRNVLFVARIHSGVVTAAELVLEEPDQPVVLQLLANRPY